MLGLMVLIIIASIVVLRILPESETIEKRKTEKSFALTLSLIRQAIALERYLGDSSPCKAEYDSLLLDPDDPVRIDAYLSALVTNNFLALENYRSPAIPQHQWGTAASQLFWQVRRNLVASDTEFGIGSFEAGVENNEGFSSPVGWVNSLTQNNNATFSTSTPDSFDDNFTWQNKFGSIGGRDGRSLRIATYTP